ncbi:MAG: hypothetical protein GWP18_00460 [Proteobacteria bacterium]|nr:hypothetical protein [Pseudomonadota bacterium]
MMTIDKPGSSGGRRASGARRPHPAAGSRAVAAALSATAAASLMVAMGVADARADLADAEAVAAAAALPPAPEIAPPTTIGSITLPPVVATDQTTTTITQAKPQPIVLEPEKRKVVAKSSGSR